MRDNGVGIEELEVVLAFSASEHLGQTAESLGCSVATVQRTLHAIEDKLGLPILERDGRRLRLRHAGWVLAEQAGHVLRGRADALDAVRAAATERQVQLRIGHTFSLGIAFVPGVVAEFLAEDSRRAVSLRQGPATTMVTSLLGGHVDAAFTSSAPVEPDIEVVALFEESAVLAVSADHALHADPASLSDARDEPFIAMPSGSNSRALLVRACARAGFSPRIVLETDDLFTVAGAVGAGIGISILPGRMTDYAAPGVRLMALAEVTPTVRTISFAYRTGSAHVTEFERLRSIALANAAKLSTES